MQLYISKLVSSDIDKKSSGGRTSESCLQKKPFFYRIYIYAMLAPGNTSPSAAPIEYPGGKKLSKIDFQSGENKSLLYIFDLWTLKGLCQCEGSLVKTSLQPRNVLIKISLTIMLYC